MLSSDIGVGGERIASFVLVCPCGEPLRLFRFNEEWVIGHPDKSCSPFVHAVDGNEVLETLMAMGRMPTQSEFIERAKRVGPR